MGKEMNELFPEAGKTVKVEQVALFPEMGAEHPMTDEEAIAEIRRGVMSGEIAPLEKPDTEDLPTSYKDIEDQLIEGMKFAEELNTKIDELKQKLLEAMEKNGVKQWKSSRMTISYTEPTTKFSFDSKKFKEENEDLFNKYQKKSNVKASVRITIKKEKEK